MIKFVCFFRGKKRCVYASSELEAKDKVAPRFGVRPFSPFMSMIAVYPMGDI